MGMIATALRELLALGVQGDALVAAVERIEAAGQIDGIPRTARQDRNRRYYDKASEKRLKASDSDVSDALAPSKEKVSPTPPSKTQPSSTPPSPPKGGSVPPRSRLKSRRCPADYEPGPTVLDLAEREGFTPGEIERELAKFRDHQFRDAHTDWDAAFRNWLRKTADHERSHPRFDPNNQTDPRRANTDSRRRAWLDLAEEQHTADVAPVRRGPGGHSEHVPDRPRLAYAGEPSGDRDGDRSPGAALPGAEADGSRKPGRHAAMGG